MFVLKLGASVEPQLALNPQPFCLSLYCWNYSHAPTCLWPEWVFSSRSPFSIHQMFSLGTCTTVEGTPAHWGLALLPHSFGLAKIH